MADVYIFDKGCDDFASFGLVGALAPEECTFEEEANGMSELTLVHPLDAMGKYTAIERERILMAEVPVRTTPEIDGGKIVTSVEKWSVKATATKAERTIYRKKSGSSRLRVLGAGTEVTVVQKPESGRYKIKYSKWTGWMEPDGLDYITSATIADNSQSIESVQSAWKVKPQLFRIYSVEKGVDSVKAYARHISYDLLYNLTTYSNSGSVSCADALAGIMNGCINAHEFAAYTNLADARTGVNWKRINPISALLDPEEGLTARYSAALVRDNWEMYILRDPGMNRGVTVEYAKNMTGMRMTESTENVVTRIIPIGEKKDGSELLLDGTIWVDSARIADYPVVHAQELKCENCKVGTDGVTTGIARARMREQAKAVFDAGGDLPEIEMDVEFISLGDTAEFALYKDLDRLFLWDYVIVRHKKLDVDITARVVSIKWDCLRERMDRMEIGSVGKTLANTGINTWQIPTGFSGSKIAGGTIGGGALMQDIISTRHLQAESVNAEKIAAESITTSKLAASSVTAEKLEAGSVDAHVVAAVAGKFGTIDAGNIETDALGAELARISRLVARTADIDWAHIKDLTTDTAIITQGVGGKLMISRLAVTEANMVSLTTGELVVKGADGSFYAVSVDENGEIVATRKQIGNDDVVDLSINAGEKLIEGSVTTACLNATEIFADSAVVRELIAANLDVDALFAREAFIDLLATSSIVGGRSLTAIAGTADAAKSAAEAAQGTAEAAQGTADAAQGTADAAQSAAEAAQSSADTARSAADAAKSAADTAQSAADAAKSAADTAQGTADGAMLATAHVGVEPPEAPIPAGRQWLDQGVEPWTLRSWIGADVRTEPEYAQTHSGNPVVLDEGRVLSLDSIRNSFGPVQAGSGDPYPAGGGKNLLPYFSAETKNGITLSVANDGTITLNGTPSANAVFVVNLASALPTGTYTMSLRSNAVNGYVVVWLENTDDWSTIGSVPNGALNNSKSFESTKAYHRAKLVVYTNAGTLSNLQLKIQLERGSAATEYAPYANIRPISGRTGVELTRCGKNLLKTIQLETQTIEGVTFTPVYTNGLLECVITNGTASAGGAIYWINDGLYFDGVFRVTGAPDVAGCLIGGNNVGAVDYNGYTHDWSGGATVSFALVVKPGVTVNNAVFKPMITRDMSATYADYAPYTGDTYTADFGQTVYGGTLDWAAGVLAVEWAKRELTGKEYWWAASSINGNSRFGMSVKVEYGGNFVGASTNQDIAPLLCDRYPAGSDSQNYRENQVISLNGAGDMNIYDPQYAAGDLASWKSYIAAQYAAGTPVQVCYRLAEPVVVQLNLPAMYPLEGTNVLYGGAGALEVDSTASGWRVVNDPAELQSAQEALALQQARMDEALNRLGMAMVLDADGVHVHRPVTNPPCETLTADDSFNVLVNSAIAATFAASYQKMGGQTVVRQTSNGLIFGG